MSKSWFLSSPPRSIIPGLSLGLSFGLAGALLSGCGADKSAALPVAGIPQVTATEVIQRSTPVVVDIVAEIKAYREVDLRPRVTGVVDTIYIRAGQPIKKDQVLFLIDPRAYEAVVNDATAGVADAEAALARIRQDIERYRPLVPENAIPKQTFEQALQQEKQAQAAVASRKAQLARAMLDLSHTQVRSPVSGQIGLQKVEEGTLASAGTTVLATVSTVDPVYAYFSVPEAAYMDYVRRVGGQKKAGEQANSRPIEMLLPDGTRYPHTGELDFIERAVSTATGTLQVRARFPNPAGLLKPGLNVRVRINPEVMLDALLIPQRAVGDLLGKRYVFVIGDGDKIEQRFVRMGEVSGELWVVLENLNAGERVVVDGLQKAQPGHVVQARLLAEAELNQLSGERRAAQASSPVPASAKK